MPSISGPLAKESLPSLLASMRNAQYVPNEVKTFTVNPESAWTLVQAELEIKWLAPEDLAQC